MSKATAALCDKCPLNTEDDTALKNIFVPSEIHDKSSIILLVEAPGYYEAKAGIPLVGQAGNDLMDVIYNLELNRSDFNLVNSVSCRPTAMKNERVINRTPTDKEIYCCNQRLLGEINNIAPVSIVAMGKVPYIALGGSKEAKVKDIAGTTFDLQGNYKVFVTYHPAAIGYNKKTQLGEMIKKNIYDQILAATLLKPKVKQFRLL